MTGGRRGKHSICCQSSSVFEEMALLMSLSGPKAKEGHAALGMRLLKDLRNWTRASNTRGLSGRVLEVGVLKEYVGLMMGSQIAEPVREFGSLCFWYFHAEKVKGSVTLWALNLDFFHESVWLGQCWTVFSDYLTLNFCIASWEMHFICNVFFKGWKETWWIDFAPLVHRSKPSKRRDSLTPVLSATSKTVLFSQASKQEAAVAKYWKYNDLLNNYYFQSVAIRTTDIVYGKSTESFLSGLANKLIDV